MGWYGGIGNPDLVPPSWYGGIGNPDLFLRGRR
jgi:hypothetical protein